MFYSWCFPPIICRPSVRWTEKREHFRCASFPVCTQNQLRIQRSESRSERRSKGAGFRGKGCVRENRGGFPARFQSARRSGPFCLGKRGRHQKRETGYACLPLLLGGFNLDIVAHLNFLLKLSYIKALCKKENSFHFPYFGGRSRK